MNKIKKIRHLPWEAIFWFCALLALALFDQDTDVHSSLCPLSNMGFQYCPGCGIGRSIGLALKGEFKYSFEMHFFGIPATLILIGRIIQLSIQWFRKSGKGLETAERP